ncbi:MAG: amidohydrolase family protein [Streptosporangiales bacterium]|nr:amidohydrolase family protein [Streptosporangiales bacterium]
MSLTQTYPARGEAAEQRVSLVDADIHPAPLPEDLLARLNEPWRSQYERFGVRVAAPPAFYPRVRNGGQRLDAWPDGGVPGSDLQLMRRQLLDEYGVDYGVLIPLQGHTYGAEYPEYAAALCRAVNEWVSEEWLDREPRLRATINIPLETPDMAVREIERCAGDPRFVQVLLPTTAEASPGNRRYWPVYAAAAEAGLPVAVHTGDLDLHRGTGPPSFYLEEHVRYANAMQTVAMSLVGEGVFDHFPTLQVVLVEAGLTWAGPLMWAMDAGREALGNQSPRLDRAPSEYFHDHFWFTTPPIEEPEDPRHLLVAIEHSGMADRILFASDYPHWDFDSPAQALPRSLPKDLRAKIFADNACRLYGFGSGGSER